MRPIEKIFVLTVEGLLFISFLFYLLPLIVKSNLKKVRKITVVSAEVFLLFVVATRWIVTGHPPVMERYEHSILSSSIILGIFIVVSSLWDDVEPAGAGVVVFTLFLIGWGLLSKPVLSPLSPQEKSFWLWIHVGFAWLAFGGFAVAAFMGVYYLINYKKELHLPLVEERIFRLLLFGFISQGLMIIAGAIWASNLWGSYWNWDPIETWSLIAWLVYGVIIHFRLIFGWKKRFTAIMSVVAFITMIITFFGVNYVTEVHIFLL